jgi:1,4-alpha-glucan branching enzyme
MLQKVYSKTGRACRVTFVLPPEAKAQSAVLCGDFNKWSQTSHPLKRRKDGSFACMLWLEAGHQYRFRYLVDGERWENDWAADAYLPNAYGGEDSAVTV